MTRDEQATNAALRKIAPALERIAVASERQAAALEKLAERESGPSLSELASEALGRFGQR